MRLVSLSIYKHTGEESLLLCQELDLTMLWFYQRGMAKEHVMFNSRLVSTKTPPSTKQEIFLEDIGVCYCWTTADGISATAICDKEYPERAAFVMLNKLMMEFREQCCSNGEIDRIT